MEDYHRFPAPDRLIADAVQLISAGTGKAAAGSFITLPVQDKSFVFLGITRGTILLSGEDLTLCAAQGTGVLLPQSPYSLFAETDSEFGYGILSGSFTEALLTKTVIDGGRFFPNGAPVLLSELSKLSHAMNLGFEMNGNTASLAAYAILMKLYGKSAPCQSANYPQLISDAMAIIRENFAFLYGIDDLAQQLFVTKNHLIREFTKAVGISPGKFLTAVRIEHAKLVLQSGEMSLETVAIASGFSGANYFCKVFRRETGMSAGEFIKSAPKIDTIHMKDTTYL